MQITEMKNRLEERIRTLENEKSMLVEEVKQLKEVVELTEKAKSLETEVIRLKKEVETLKDKIPQKFLQEFGESTSLISEKAEEGENCPSCEEELF